MSSRALRKLQANSGIPDIGVGLDSSDDDEEETFSATFIDSRKISRNQKKKNRGHVHDRVGGGATNPFELLNEDDEQKDGSENCEDCKEEEDEEETAAIEQVKNASKKRKKKNKKKRKDNQPESSGHQQKEIKDDDEVEASVLAVNELLGEPTPVIAVAETNPLALNMKPLLHVDHRNLNPENEMRRMFGSEMFRGENREQQRNRRQRNRPIMRSTRLVQPKNSWHPTGGCGLSMKFLGEKEGFLFENSLPYQKLQDKFLDGIESGHPEAIFSILQENPYHIDTLITLADFYNMNEDFQTGAECIEKAIFGLECAFHSMFNLAAGNCFLDYKRRENRCFYICLFKHIVNLGRRGCNRTAFEFCKVLLSLDPVNDPLNCLSMIDYYALRCEQYDYLIRLEAEVSYSSSNLQTPNFAFSTPLAHYRIALKEGTDTSRADEMIQDRLLLYPMMVLTLLDKCSVQPDARVEKHPFLSVVNLDSRSSELKRLVSLYSTRCEACWKEHGVLQWLERMVNSVLDVVDMGEDPRIKQYAERRQRQFKHPPPSIIRHYSLSGVPIPAHITSRAMYAHDPYPPSDSVDGYPRGQRPRRSDSSEQGLFRLLLQSLMPSYNPNAPPEAQAGQPVGGGEEEGAEGGARAMPQQLQDSVHAIMDAMRNLLNNVAVQPPPEAAGEDEGLDDGGWEEEEEDYRHNQGH